MLHKTLGNYRVATQLVFSRMVLNMKIIWQEEIQSLEGKYSEGNEQYKIKISNKFPVLKTLIIILIYIEFGTVLGAMSKFQTNHHNES
jgi:hypothetical protein